MKDECYLVRLRFLQRGVKVLQERLGLSDANILHELVQFVDR
jgi:hypothetical protein